MLWVAKQRARGVVFDHIPVLHDVYAVSHVAHDAQIVGDQQNGHAQRLLQIFEQLQNLRLHRYVKGGGRFVGDE